MKTFGANFIMIGTLIFELEFLQMWKKSFRVKLLCWLSCLSDKKAIHIRYYKQKTVTKKPNACVEGTDAKYL